LLHHLAVAKGEYIGLASYQAEVRGMVYLLCGGSVLYVLRPKGDEFQLAGGRYIHGLMDDEALKFLENGRTRVEEMSIA
jgi:hypothetical protein